MSKSAMAFRFSCVAFFESTKSAYFWTFTFKNRHSIPEACERWSKFANALAKYGRQNGKDTIYGLRVFELHPGGHGLHIHALFNRRISIHAVRRRAEEYGFWWIDVRKVTAKTAEGDVLLSEYLSKYLAKSARPPELKGRRIWAAIGKWEHSKCGNMVLESEFTAAFKLRRNMIEQEKELCERVGVPYRLESNLETMAWASWYYNGVRAGHASGLTGRIVDVTERVVFHEDLFHGRN